MRRRVQGRGGFPSTLAQIFPSPVAARAALHIVRQPFPAVFTKGKSVEEGQLAVRLLLAPATQCASLSRVAAELVMDPAVEAKARSTKKGAAAPALSNESAAFDKHMCAALAPRFEMGTRKTAAHMVFKAEVRLPSRETLRVEGFESGPCIVITNESQWAEAEAEARRMALFKDVRQVSWPTVANTLSREFLSVTRQDWEMPARELSPSHLQHLKTLLKNQEVVSEADFADFYGNFSKCLATLKYQRFVGSLWTSGLIAGFISRADVDRCLHGRAVGTFLLRFSESQAGSLSVAYVGMDCGVAKVKHYLIQPSDVASSKRTVADFLSDQSQFQTMVCFRDKMEFHDKDDALQGFVQERPKLEAPGYESKIT